MFKNNLRHYRKLKKITQKELAEKVNVTSDYIYMIEKGTRNPGIFLAKRISDILGKSMEEIFFNNKMNN